MAMYFSLNSVKNCMNDVTCLSGRLTNQSSIMLVSVLMNILQCTASEPRVSIICVWKSVRWASGSFTPVKVALGPTNVAGITASMIACENGIGKALGGVASSCSSTARSTACCKLLCSSSLVLPSFSFLACDVARSIYIRS